MTKGIVGLFVALAQPLACAHEVESMSPLEHKVEQLAAQPPAGLVETDDGRKLAWAEYGSPDGFAVFYLSGGDSSRLEGAALADAAAALNVRVIALDRPGFGASDPAPARRLVDWPADMAAVADKLGIERFSVIGLSGGGPHALATAWAMPDRLHRLVIVGSAPLPALEHEARDVAFPFRMISKLTTYAPWAMKFILKDQMKMSLESSGKLLERTRGGMSAPDAEWLSDDKGGALFAASMRVAYQQGVEGSLQEHKLYRRDWGFPLDGVRTPTSFFIGDQDNLASQVVNERMAGAVGDASFTIVPGEGHLSLIPNHARRVLQAAVR